MDLSTIIDHLDNFVTTWKGWGAVVEGIKGIFGLDKGDFTGVSSAVKGLSSVSSKS